MRPRPAERPPREDEAKPSKIPRHNSPNERAWSEPFGSKHGEHQVDQGDHGQESGHVEHGISSQNSRSEPIAPDDQPEEQQEQPNPQQQSDKRHAPPPRSLSQWSRDRATRRVDSHERPESSLLPARDNPVQNFGHDRPHQGTVGSWPVLNANLGPQACGSPQDQLPQTFTSTIF